MMVSFTKERFSVDEALKELKSEGTGAIVCFLGIVRAESGVDGLEIEVYEGLGIEEMKRIEDEARRLFPINGTKIIHRKGELSVGEDIVLVAASAPYRDEAFQAARFMIDQIKARCPIWKKEKGTGKWVVG